MNSGNINNKDTNKLDKFLRTHTIMLKNKDEYLKELQYLSYLYINNLENLKCKYFINEAIKLVQNSILLMEKGYFDCSIYSLRAARELLDYMIEIHLDSDSYKKWENKQLKVKYKDLKQHIENNNIYKQIKDGISDFFDEIDSYKPAFNKIVHKESYDTFYDCEYKNNDKNIQLKIEEESELEFDKIIRLYICILYVYFIIIEPELAIMADPELNLKYINGTWNETVNLDFLKTNYKYNLLDRIYKVDIIRNLILGIKNNPSMNETIFVIKREQFFNYSEIEQIREQKFLLTDIELFIYNLMANGIKFSDFFAEDEFIPIYSTDIKSKKEIDFDYNLLDNISEFPQSKFLFNNPKNNVYRTYITLNNKRYMLEHNEKFDDKEIEVIHNFLL